MARYPAVPLCVREKWANAQRGCAPGHQFTIYFAIWAENWRSVDREKSAALKECLSLESVAELSAAVRQRQRAACQSTPEDNHLILDARSIAPFATGLGIEHPVENGFAFLTPYGIPYLAGSGVKGVLRKAAEDRYPNNKALVEMLFGTENEQDEQGGAAADVKLTRGALTFWDVFPVPMPNGATALRVEVMTPHHSNYLQKTGTPNDSEQPIPIPFLVVPAGFRFSFLVTCDPKRITLDLGEKSWKQVVEDLFFDAFSWLGFGAKTAVGYGAMELSSMECQWVSDTIIALSRPGVQEPLFGRALAEAWRMIPDARLKEEALRDIKGRWGTEWNLDRTPGRARARAIYEGPV